MESGSWVVVELDSGEILWKKFEATNGWRNASVSLPHPYVK